MMMTMNQMGWPMTTFTDELCCQVSCLVYFPQIWQPDDDPHSAAQGHDTDRQARLPSGDGHPRQAKLGPTVHKKNKQLHKHASQTQALRREGAEQRRAVGRGGLGFD